MFAIDFPEIVPKRLAVKLTAVGERNVRNGHPWIFTDSILKLNKGGKSGDLTIVFSKNKNEVIGIGLLDPDSPIRIKMLTNIGGVTIDTSFFEEKINKAFALRAELLETVTNSYRLLFGENDGFPGFIADVYDNALVVKLYSAIWFPYLKAILEKLIETTSCETVVLRLSRKLQGNGFHNFYDGQILFGKLSDEVVQFTEHGVKFSANVIKGHKTGYFLDHRHNRKNVGALSKNKKVLDVFAYAGGFSIHALANGAKEVTSLDISEQALQVAKENAQLNSFSGVHKTISGDAFAELKKLCDTNSKFDVVVIDPPSFAKRKTEISIALKKYEQLAKLGEKITFKNGTLVLASCSSRISLEEFFDINNKALQTSGRNFECFKKTFHDIDHPITFPEGAYLKCGYYRFLD